MRGMKYLRRQSRTGNPHRTRHTLRRSRHTLTALLLCSLVCAGNSAAQTQSKTTDAIIRQVERGLLPAVVTPHTVPKQLAMRMRELKVPGLSVAVVDHGQLAWAHAWGMARPSVPMTASTLLQAASISKPVSAVAALQAVEQGQLSLDGDLNTSLRTWHIPLGAQSAAKPVSLRRLLSHSAGFTVAGFEG